MIGNRKIIALCISRIQDEASNEYITALDKLVYPLGYSLFVYNTCSVIGEDGSGESVQASVYDLMDYDVIDVVIVYEEVIHNTTISEILIERARKHNVPTIVIGKEHEGCINIEYDYENGFAQVVRHLICEHGLTKLHFMAGTPENPFSEQRLESFKQVLEENDLAFDQSMVSYGMFWSEPAQLATEELIAAGNVPQAIVCANDKMAIAVCATLTKHGLRVPEDVAVTGFDGIMEIKFSTPRITSAVCDCVDLAEQTVALLTERSEWVNTTGTVLVPLRLCIGESCGCNGEKALNASEYFNLVSDRFYRFQDEDIELSKLTARVQRCESVEQVAIQMKDRILYDISCVVEVECVDETMNPLKSTAKSSNGDREMVLLYESDIADPFVPYRFSLKKVLPRLEELLAENRIMIFTSLYQVDVPIGYVLFYFRELVYSNYVKVPQTVNALNNAIGGYRNVRYRHFLMNQLDEMYRIDMLTGLRNRRGFETDYQKLLSEKTKEQQFTIILADLDGLKYINDNYGHKEGDVAIYTAAQALVGACPKGALITRFGGDEMLAVCQGIEDAEKIKADFYKYLKEFNDSSDKEYAVQASAGIYHTTENDDLSFEGIVEKADRLMYMEKARRKSHK